MPISAAKADFISSSTQGASAQGSNKLGKNEFLKILTTQLANQDPTKPMDSHEFVAQLAQFSALEQQTNTNDTLTKMLALQQAAGGTAAVGMVGKDALYDAKQMDLSAGSPISVNANLAADATDVIMEVDDVNGEQIRKQSFGPKNAGDNTLTWDGMNESGVKQAPGSYYVTVSAVNIEGKTVQVTQQARGHITGVTFAGDSPQLLIGKTSIPLTDVQSISESSNSK
jgi:flagellar basal-body rod modification protein FlgD